MMPILGGYERNYRRVGLRYIVTRQVNLQY